MPTDASFRFSTYLTFALVCAALGYAEYNPFGEVAVFAGLAVVGLGVLYFLESRVTLLSIAGANRLAIVIALGYAVWVAYRIKREFETDELINMGWHLMLVALCGPFVMLLLVAKVARRDKHAGDYWGLHGIALVGIVLAAAVAEELACFVLVALYLVSAVWSLTLLYLGRARGAIAPIPGGRQPATKAVAVAADPTGHRTDLLPAVLWALAAVLVAVPLYLLTPRSDAAKAEFGKPRIEIGYAGDQMVDLKQVGRLKSNPETAFEVSIEQPEVGPRLTIRPDQRWRGHRVLRVYSNGEWKPPPVDEQLPQITPLATNPPVWSPPNLGPNQYTLTFKVPGRTRGTFVADPVQWVGDQPTPLAAYVDGVQRGWLPVADGSFFWEPALRGPQGGERTYFQAYATGPDPDIGPPFRFKEQTFERRLNRLRENPVPAVETYAKNVLKELIGTGELPKDCHDDSGRILPEHQDKVARRFAAYLATTPTLEYTTDLKRVKKEVDPIEDFLFHSKAGHCERFATALCLMLRSVGIPAVFVLGFKGAELVEENGSDYVVRQEHAHAWVSALVVKPGEPFDKKQGHVSRVYQWRSLDPTPGAAQIGDEEANRPWWQQAGGWADTQFQEYVANYTPEQRQQALANFVAGMMRPSTLLALGALVPLAVGARYLRRRIVARRNPPPAVSDPGRWFNELVAALAAHGIVPAPGDTPLEFATRAASALRARPGCEAVAEVPPAWAEAYYQDRYGGAAPSDARLAELEAGLDALRLALAGKSK